jgi:hypothetical protein
MEKNSKRNSKLLFLIILTVSLIVVGVAIAIFVVNGMAYSSGTFIMKSESRNSDSWTFSAREANGHSSIVRNLSQGELDTFFVDSRIADGEMFLILSQGEINQIINLSEGTLNLSAKDLGMDVFNPGRISIQLKFDSAKNVDVNINWRYYPFYGFAR